LGPLKGPRGPFRGPRGPLNGPRGPFKGPRGPLKEPRSHFKGPRCPLKGHRGPRSPLKGPRGPLKEPRGPARGLPRLSGMSATQEIPIGADSRILTAGSLYKLGPGRLGRPPRLPKSRARDGIQQGTALEGGSSSWPHLLATGPEGGPEKAPPRKP